MRNTKRILSLLLVAGIVIILFAGCQGGSAGNQNAEQPVTLRFSWWGGDARHKATLAAIDLYQKNHTNVKIEAEYQGYEGYQDKLTTTLAGGTAPDVIQFDYLWRQTLGSNPDFFIDYRDYSKLLDLSQFNMKIVEPYGMINGKLFGIPTGLGPYALTYYKSVCEKAGVDTSHPWTWDDLLKEGAKINQMDSNAYFITGGEYESILRPYVVQQTGNQFINDDYTLGFTKDQLKSAFDFLQQLYDNKVYQPPTESASYTDLTQNPKWLNKQIAATFEWASGIEGDFGDNIKDAAVMMLPCPSGAKDSGIQCPIAQLLTVSKKSKNIDAAVQFVNAFLNDPEMVKTLGTVRSIPASKIAVDTLQKANLLNPVVKQAVDGALSNPGLVYNTITDDSELLTIGNNVLEEFRYGRLNADQAADEFISRFNSKLDELKAATGK